MHADNCLIPKSILRRLLQHDLPRLEFRLIDDYWFSFVLSHYLRIPIWKIRSQDLLSFESTADDPEIALYHNPYVREQRVNFYIYHMRRGWPFVDLPPKQLEPSR
jgi:hypothetical protein